VSVGSVDNLSLEAMLDAADKAMYASKRGDWIFASFKLNGRQPRTASILAADHLRPAAIAAGVLLKPGQRPGSFTICAIAGRLSL